MVVAPSADTQKRVYLTLNKETGMYEADIELEDGVHELVIVASDEARNETLIRVSGKAGTS